MASFKLMATFSWSLCNKHISSSLGLVFKDTDFLFMWKIILVLYYFIRIILKINPESVFIHILMMYFILPLLLGVCLLCFQTYLMKLEKLQREEYERMFIRVEMLPSGYKLNQNLNEIWGVETG